MVFSVGIISPLITRGHIINMQTHNNALTRRTRNCQTEPEALGSVFTLLLRPPPSPESWNPRIPLAHPVPDGTLRSSPLPHLCAEQTALKWLWTCSPGCRTLLSLPPASVCAWTRSAEGLPLAFSHPWLSWKNHSCCFSSCPSSHS